MGSSSNGDGNGDDKGGKDVCNVSWDELWYGTCHNRIIQYHYEI